MSPHTDEVTRLNPIARVILQGLYDDASPWHMLLGVPYVLKTIWLNVVDHWKSKVKETVTEGYGLSVTKARAGFFVESDKDYLVEFPPPSDININMMPFRMTYKFEVAKLPEYLYPYWNQIIKKCYQGDEMGKIGFLTIQESYVREGSSQRRPGVHTESPGVALIRNKDGKIRHTSALLWWGAGYAGKVSGRMFINGGIYMDSNVENSCRVWNCQIERPKDGNPDVVGNLGDIEHLREFLPASSEVMAGNTLYWLTDRTPHESLPLRKGTYRQFFRLVTSQVSVWYEDHSTRNPLGVVPDPKITKIVKGSKFDGSCYQVDEPASL